MSDPKMRNLIVDVSIVHEFLGNVDAPDRNGILRHQDLDRALDLQARKKVAKYRDGYLAVDHRRAFIPAVVSTSSRIHSELLRVLYILADIKTTRFFSDIGDKDYSHEAFRWRRGEFFWHIRAKLGLACAQAATMRSQVVGQSLWGSTRDPYHGFGLYPSLLASCDFIFCFVLCGFSLLLLCLLFACGVEVSVTQTHLQTHLARSRRSAGFLIQPVYHQCHVAIAKSTSVNITVLDMPQLCINFYFGY